MTTASRYRPQVRATRAYLAGFGTSGSLLAGAALLFVLASAIVAFRGWPQVGDGLPSTAAVSVPPSPPGAGARSRAGRILAAAVAATRAGAARGSRVAGVSAGRIGRGDTRTGTSGGAQPTPTGGSGPPNS